MHRHLSVVSFDFLVRGFKKNYFETFLAFRKNQNYDFFGNQVLIREIHTLILSSLNQKTQRNKVIKSNKRYQNAASFFRPTWSKPTERLPLIETKLKKKTDFTVLWFDVWTWKWPRMLVSKASEALLAPVMGHFRFVSWSAVLCRGATVLKIFCKPMKTFIV